MILVSAGDAITAKLIAQAGFDGIWVSGFEASARLGLPDNGSITMTEMLNITTPIVRASNLPVYVDCDTGYGNMARTAREFQAIGARGICLEDNVEPKINSLWGSKRPLVDKEIFCARLRTIKDNSLTIIARTEALIRDFGIYEARARAEAYYCDGEADMVLIHTRDKTGTEALSIPSDMNMDIPLVIVPTMFSHMTNQQLYKTGYKMIIWANQTERTKIKAVRKALRILKQNDCAKILDTTEAATIEDMKGLASNE